MQTTTKTSQGATVTVRTSKNVMRAFTVTAIIDANAARGRHARSRLGTRLVRPRRRARRGCLAHRSAATGEFSFVHGGTKRCAPMRTPSSQPPSPLLPPCGFGCAAREQHFDAHQHLAALRVVLSPRRLPARLRTWRR